MRRDDGRTYLGGAADAVAATAAATRVRGPSEFFVAIDALPGKLVQARPLGADETRIRALGGADTGINFAPSPKIRPTITEAINPFGWIVSVAMMAEPVALVFEWLTYNGVRVTGASGGARQQLKDLPRLAARHELRVDIERIRLSEINGIFARLARGDVARRFAIDFKAAA